jgi:uncharacterized protein (TIGR00369 family)
MDDDVPAGFTAIEDPGGFVAHAGPLLEGPDGALGVRARDHHLNAAGSVMGGFLMTLADAAFGRAVRESAEGDAQVATVSLTTDFLRPAPAGSWVEARTTVERLGGHLAFADCSVRADGEEVVRARAVFAVREG